MSSVPLGLRAKMHACRVLTVCNQDPPADSELQIDDALLAHLPQLWQIRRSKAVHALVDSEAQFEFYTLLNRPACCIKCYLWPWQKELKQTHWLFCWTVRISLYLCVCVCVCSYILFVARCRHYAAQLDNPATKWSLPESFAVVYTNIEGELIISGVFLRLYINNPGWVLRKPKEFIVELLEKWSEIVAVANPNVSCCRCRFAIIAPQSAMHMSSIRRNSGAVHSAPVQLAFTFTFELAFTFTFDLQLHHMFVTPAYCGAWALQ